MQGATSAPTTIDVAPPVEDRQSMKLVVLASSLGTAFEFYDFYLYGLLAINISSHFFSGVNETTAFIFALAAFAAGFAIRPFGALVFGRVGDIVGRKYTFLVTMTTMGLSTFCVGLLPSYSSIGVASPLMLVALRLVQGLALGGEYGGAATYVAEHAPPHQRGLYTGWIQTTAALGLIAALLVVIASRSATGEQAFGDWGWRLPFLLSIVLLAISLWIRLQLNESPLFCKMKAQGGASKAPITEAFGQWKNLKWVLIVLFGAITGQAVIGYTSQFYALFFLEKILKVDGAQANIFMMIALLMAMPIMVFFGWLSDKIGRKPIIITGCVLATLCYFPLFHALTRAANPALARAQASVPVVVLADPSECSLQFDPIGKNTFDKSSCDIAKAKLAKSGIPYSNQPVSHGVVAQVKLGNQLIAVPDPKSDPKLAPSIAAFGKTMDGTLAAAGYPASADPAGVNKVAVVGLLLAMLTFITMVFGPLAAVLVELFPTRIRYSSISLPYNIANGWFGGFLPTTAFAMVAATGDIYYGLWYPVVITGATAVIGLLFLPETFRRNLAE